MSHLQNDSNLVWLDLEMTGLDPDQYTIIEIATIITDSQLNILAEGPVIAIYHDPEVLNRVEKWSRDTHTKSGLLKRVESSPVKMEQAEEMTLGFIRHYCREKTSPLCGNSIGHDRRFLERYMPKLFDYFHYRNIDVSTVKELVRRWYPNGPPPPTKKGNHLALDDIRESIRELIFYRNYYFVKQ
ncbi:MAG: oligoribonuclease [Candidatus Manganitrophaceae bacterium]